MVVAMKVASGLHPQVGYISPKRSLMNPMKHYFTLPILGVILRVVATVAPVQRVTRSGIRLRVFEKAGARELPERCLVHHKSGDGGQSRKAVEKRIMAIEWGFDGNKTLRPTIFMGI